MKKKLATFSIDMWILNQLDQIADQMGCTKSWLVQFCLKDKLDYILRNKKKYFMAENTPEEKEIYDDLDETNRIIKDMWGR